MVRKSAPEQVETVVVGSGFGGSVTAFRLAEAGRDVLVLERGRAYPPGAFPRTPREVAREYWNPGEGRHGLFDIWSLGGFDAVVSSGLGGGSLVFANALMRADERWFVQPDARASRGGAATGGRAGAEAASRTRGAGGSAGAGSRRRAAAGRPWPISRADLEPHYDAVEKMLGAAPFPAGRPGYEATERTTALRAAAERMGLEWRQPALAVSFAALGVTAPGLALPEAPYGNVHGRARATCQLAGDCVLGCNHGAKNSLDHTYLSAAAYHGAEIRTRCEVLAIAPDDGGGWVVTYAEHHGAVDGTSRDLAMLPARTVRCARVVLAAGALGSTYLLLRSRAALPGLSPMLGHGFSGNGDALGLVAGARREDGSLWPLGAAPTVTSAVAVPDGPDGEPGFHIQDAGVPTFVSWLLAGHRAAAGGGGGGLRGSLVHPLRLARDWAAERLRGGPDDLRGQLSRLAEAGADGEAVLPLLAMGRPAADGVLRLDGDRLGLERAGADRDVDAERMRAAMARLADGLGGRLESHPLATPRRRVTAHPLGGAPMGDNPRDGVVDGLGQVFDHPGLYVLDGAALPGPLGVGPALTIAAFADLAVQRMLDGSRGRAGGVPRPRVAASGDAAARGTLTHGAAAASAARKSAAGKSATGTGTARTKSAAGTGSAATRATGASTTQTSAARTGAARARGATAGTSAAGAGRSGNATSAEIPSPRSDATPAAAARGKARQPPALRTPVAARAAAAAAVPATAAVTTASSAPAAAARQDTERAAAVKASDAASAAKGSGATDTVKGSGATGAASAVKGSRAASAAKGTSATKGNGVTGAVKGTGVAGAAKVTRAAGVTKATKATTATKAAGVTKAASATGAAPGAARNSSGAARGVTPAPGGAAVGEAGSASAGTGSRRSAGPGSPAGPASAGEPTGRAAGAASAAAPRR
ncbi:GMC oxidoreductase [Pseudofrankia sp. BMG5.36]|uniref:GMC oxidoreductase n=1 Tax=Pseudofrankia sp. BMG5.36 TaxID=1834512 RepID=UPI0008D92B1B|nr:GMC oxidoreductase [Pseudofrankia sp. BMG5.36]OHV65191.1 hypothetical protein BCD48_03495 [Pseudofrankia sp. BMG5.36]